MVGKCAKVPSRSSSSVAMLFNTNVGTLHDRYLFYDRVILEASFSGSKDECAALRPKRGQLYLVLADEAEPCLSFRHQRGELEEERGRQVLAAQQDARVIPVQQSHALTVALFVGRPVCKVSRTGHGRESEYLHPVLPSKQRRAAGYGQRGCAAAADVPREAPLLAPTVPRPPARPSAHACGTCGRSWAADGHLRASD
eukprot:scaffold6592_cov411-Prasinococcus_capsulatus_cf.AAC.11